MLADAEFLNQGQEFSGLQHLGFNVPVTCLPVAVEAFQHEVVVEESIDELAGNPVILSLSPKRRDDREGLGLQANTDNRNKRRLRNSLWRNLPATDSNRPQITSFFTVFKNWPVFWVMPVDLP